MAAPFFQAKPRMLRSLFRRLFKYLLWFMAASVVLVAVLRWVPPPGTMVMVERKVGSWVDGQPIDLQRDWRSWEQLPDSLKVAVIAGEDQHFAEHHGFDLPAIQQALAHNERGGSIRGASTLSQQVAKNVFLWSGRSWLRKGLEAWFTLLIETLWTKQRILEVYLNSAEWGPGVFGAQAAARYHFGLDAERLSRTQASQLAAVLPSPLKWARPGRAPTYASARPGFASRCGSWAATTTCCAWSAESSTRRFFQGLARHREHQSQVVVRQVRGQAQLRIDPGLALGQLQAQARLAETGQQPLGTDPAFGNHAQRHDRLVAQLSFQSGAQWLRRAARLQRRCPLQAQLLLGAQAQLAFHLPGAAVAQQAATEGQAHAI